MEYWEKIKILFANPLVSRSAIAILVIIAIFVLVKISQNTTRKYVKDTDARYRVRKTLSFIGYLLMVLVILFVFEVKLTGISVFLGVAGAGIAFALQEVIVSVAGYLAIFTGGFFSVGDRIKLGGITGDVIDIGVLRTTLMETGDWIQGTLYNGAMVRIANSFVFKEPVFNYSGEFPFLWDEVIVPIKTQGDFEFAEQEFSRILIEEVGDYSKEAEATWKKITGKYKLEDARVTPLVTFVFDENWITFTLRYVVDFQKRRSTKHQISKKLLTTIRNSNGKIEVASAAMEITAFPKNNN